MKSQQPTIFEHTSKRINNFRETLSRNKSYGYMNKLTDTELPATFKFVYAKGLLGHNVLDLKRNFIENIGHPIFCSAFNYKHYVLIKAMIIFDDCATRDQKWKADRFAEFRNIFEAFNKQCAKTYPLIIMSL